ncbi:MAG: GerAB/ArcD/ProY family transporter [Firmicutes bacterium]|nr:GerAB/ArcD/ProY family transporter [Bacillota bacterium]
MSNKVVFGNWEAISLIMLVICNQVFLNMPRIVAEVAGTGGGILIIYVAILAFIALWLIIKLYKNYEGMDLIDLGEYIAGRAGKIFVGTVLSVYLIFVISIILREFTENMKIISLQVSPISFVSLFFIVGMAVAAYLGLEAIVRYNSIAVPIILISYILILLGVTNYFNFTRLAPFLGFGPYELFVAGIPKVSLFSEIIVLFFIFPYLKSYKIFKKAGYTGFAISALILIISIFSYLLIYAYPISIENFLPVYQLSRLFSYGRFFERIESIFLIVWATTALLYLSSSTFFAVFFIKKAYDLEYYRPLIIPVIIIIFNLSLLPPNLMTAIKLEVTYFRSFAWIFTFALPLVLLLISSFIKKYGLKERIKRRRHE